MDLQIYWSTTGQMTVLGIDKNRKSLYVYPPFRHKISKHAIFPDLHQLVADDHGDITTKTQWRFVRERNRLNGVWRKMFTFFSFFVHGLQPTPTPLRLHQTFPWLIQWQSRLQSLRELSWYERGNDHTRLLQMCRCYVWKIPCGNSTLTIWIPPLRMRWRTDVCSSCVRRLLTLPVNSQEFWQLC